MGRTANEGVFRFLGSRAGAEQSQPSTIAADDPKRDYYWEAGAHPEIVARLWDQLGRNLPATSRALVFGTPALIHQGSGIVLAFALGTEYALRFPRRVSEGGRSSGLRTVAN